VGDRARLVGINHVALEVGDLDAALEWYGAIFQFELRGRVPGMVFLDMGDQFIAVAEVGGTLGADGERHFGLVVDSAAAARAALEAAGAEVLPGRGLDFRDPWGNHVQVVEYGEVQFSKTSGALRAIGLDGLEKSAEARRQMREKGLEG
jgi:catechol 2,3-dioxygenase-like lactoylglutathione lyase family enzyme